MLSQQGGLLINVPKLTQQNIRMLVMQNIGPRMKYMHSPLPQTIEPRILLEHQIIGVHFQYALEGTSESLTVYSGM